MAKNIRPSQTQNAQLTPEQMQLAIKKLERRIAELNAFNPSQTQERFSPNMRALSNAVELTLSEIYGTDSFEFKKLRAAADLDTAGLSMGSPIPLREVIQGLERGKQRSIALLNQARQSLLENLSDLGVPVSPATTSNAAANDRIAITTQRGRIEITDPPPNSGFKLNPIADDTENIARLTAILNKTIDAIRGDNSVLGALLKKQLLVLLQTAIQELEAPYIDSNRFKAVANAVEQVSVKAAGKSPSGILATEFRSGVEAINSLIDAAVDTDGSSSPF